jgi:hypothetical protein
MIFKLSIAATGPTAQFMSMPFITMLSFLVIATYFHPVQSTTPSVLWENFPAQCHWPALAPPVSCAGLSSCIALLRALGDAACNVSGKETYTPLCESDEGAMVLGASARGRGMEENSSCRDVADGLEWVVESCASCQGKNDSF